MPESTFEAVPLELSADASANPGKYRPKVERGEMVRVLAISQVEDDDAPGTWAVVGGIYPARRMADSKYEIGEDYYGLLWVDLDGRRGMAVDAWERWTQP